MAVGRPMPSLVLSDDEVQQRQSIANSRSLAYSIVQWLQIVLACAAGEANTAISNRMGLTAITVGKWRKRYLDLGLEGLYGELRPRRPCTYEEDKLSEVIKRTLQCKPADGSTQWTARSLAAAIGIFRSTVHRLLQTFSLQPPSPEIVQSLLRSLLVSQARSARSLGMVEKGRDIAGFYLNPPDKAVVLCVDENSQIQSLDRTQPLFPNGSALCRGCYPRLYLPRHHHTVCRSGRGDRFGDRRVQP